MALGFVPVNGSGEEMSVSGFASLPACCRGTRGYQHFFVNGRYVKSRTMMAALEEAYANQKMVGKFPGCVLHLTTKLNAVDVNVHPTKQEVKFGSDKRVFDAVYYAVKSALERDRTHPTAVLERPQSTHTVRGNQTAFHAQQLHTAAGGAADVPPVPTAKHPVRPGISALERILTAPERREGMPLHDFTASGSKVSGVESSVHIPPGDVMPPQPDVKSAAVIVPQKAEPHVPRVTPQHTEPLVPIPQLWRLAGEVLNTYIIVEQEDKVFLIDKHAAHERMHFDRLKAQGHTPMSQLLLTPVVFTPPAEEGAVLLQHLELLGQFGFEAEDFGGGAILVRQCPDYMDAGLVEETLCELSAKLITTGRADPDAVRDELMHTMACKAAIKGGQKNDRSELQKVAEAVMSGAVKYCPHGRPVAIELTRGQLEKQFKRA